METLPNELILHIAQFISAEDQTQLALVNSRLKCAMFDATTQFGRLHAYVRAAGTRDPYLVMFTVIRAGDWRAMLTLAKQHAIYLYAYETLIIICIFDEEFWAKTTLLLKRPSMAVPYKNTHAIRAHISNDTIVRNLVEYRAAMGDEWARKLIAPDPVPVVTGSSPYYDSVIGMIDRYRAGDWSTSYDVQNGPEEVILPILRRGVRGITNVASPFSIRGTLSEEIYDIARKDMALNAYRAFRGHYSLPPEFVKLQADILVKHAARDELDALIRSGAREESVPILVELMRMGELETLAGTTEIPPPTMFCIGVHLKDYEIIDEYGPKLSTAEWEYLITRHYYAQFYMGLHLHSYITRKFILPLAKEIDWYSVKFGVFDIFHAILLCGIQKIVGHDICRAASKSSMAPAHALARHLGITGTEKRCRRNECIFE